MRGAQARLELRLHGARPWPGPGLPASASAAGHTRPVPATPGTATGALGPDFPLGPRATAFSQGRGELVDRSQTAAVQRMTATPAGPVATVGRPAGQRRARPQGLSYTDWGATGEPRNRYSTRGERFPGKPLGRRPPPSFHPTHTHARTPHARSAIRQQTPRPGRHSPGRHRAGRMAASAAGATSRPRAALQAGPASLSSAAAVGGLCASSCCKKGGAGEAA